MAKVETTKTGVVGEAVRKETGSHSRRPERGWADE